MRVSVFLDGEYATKWVADALDEMVQTTDAEVTLVLINTESADGTVDLLKKAVKKPHVARIRLGQLLWSKIREPPQYMEKVPLDEIDALAGAQRRFVDPIPHETFGNLLPQDAVSLVSERSDLAFRYGFGVIKGDVLSAPKHGVVSFHHGNIREYRGGPPGFWEFLNGDPGGVTLQQLTETLDGGRIVAFEPVEFDDCWTWRETNRRLFEASTGLLAEAVRRFSDPDFEPERVGDEELGPLYTFPRWRNYLRYLYRNNCGRLRRMIG